MVRRGQDGGRRCGLPSDSLDSSVRGNNTHVTGLDGLFSDPTMPRAETKSKNEDELNE